jgi:hypothetical protein
MTTNDDGHGAPNAGSDAASASESGEQPVEEFTIRVSAEKWRKFEYWSLRNRIQTELIEAQEISPASGSHLEADNNFLAPFKSSFQSLVTHHLFSVFDHLQLVAWTLETLPHPLIFSQFSLVRAALGGASTAYWVISGDSNLRRMRGLKLAFYDLEHETNFSKIHVTNPSMHEPENAEALARCHAFLYESPSRLRAIHQEYCNLYAATGKTKMPSFDRFGKINETEIVKEASQTFHQLGKMGNDIEIELQYRIMSGFVHNCQWATQTGATMTQQGLSDKTVTYDLSGNAENIYNGALTAFDVAKLAKARFKELCALR